MSEYSIYDDYEEEKINGKVYLMSPSANPKHGTIIKNLVKLIDNYIESNNLKCVVFGDNLDVYFTEDEYVIPDVTVVCDENKLEEDGYHGIPTLIVEVISPGSYKHDTEDKLKLYEDFKVPEFWLIDYNNKTLKQYTLIQNKYADIRTWVLLDQSEFKRLSKEEKLTYTTKFYSSSFQDLELDLKYIFKPIFR
ncbi:MAG: Uma2 family endonuclease [Oscillospiraceae bacterium]|nr:Uma2 family endonuclease [Oscillospiraceae bacterium]